MAAQVTPILLTENVPFHLPSSAISLDDAKVLRRDFSTRLRVEEPGYFNDYNWTLTSLGSVGYIPVSPTLHLSLQPKVPLGNLFRMLELVYFKGSIQFFDGLYDADSLIEFFEQLAGMLAKGVLNRFRRGIYRAYEPYSDDLPFVRGRLDTRQITRQPWLVGLPCDYEEHTPDIDDNQIIGWTLQCILRSGLCTGQTLPHVRAAYRHLQSMVTSIAFPSRACLDRLYNRLNSDYRPLHALCYFFLSESGPTHRHGDHAMLPFLVDMARLYERFVALWLKQHLEPRYVVKIQEHQTLGENTGVSFDIDIVIYDPTINAVCWVLDTKYKATQSGNDDLYQAVTYATLKHTSEAILIYPAPLSSPLDVQIGGVRVRSLTFSLEGSLDAAGADLLVRLSNAIPVSSD